MWKALCDFIQTSCYELLEWAKCGEGAASAAPTALWAAGAAALAQQLLSALFRRFIFRRVPLWELVLQNLLFVWMLIYSLHFWVVLVKVVKIFVEYCYHDVTVPPFVFSDYHHDTPQDLATKRMMQQWVIWMLGVAPLAVYIHTRPRPEPPPLMIWITTNPWQRREMGAYGYYLNRPLSSLPSPTAPPRHPTALRKAFSDSNILIKEPPKRKRHSKSV